MTRTECAECEERVRGIKRLRINNISPGLSYIDRVTLSVFTITLFLFQDFCGIVAQAYVMDKTEQLRRTFVVLVFLGQ